MHCWSINSICFNSINIYLQCFSHHMQYVYRVEMFWSTWMWYSLKSTVQNVIHPRDIKINPLKTAHVNGYRNIHGVHLNLPPHGWLLKDGIVTHLWVLRHQRPKSTYFWSEGSPRSSGFIIREPRMPKQHSMTFRQTVVEIFRSGAQATGPPSERESESCETWNRTFLCFCTRSQQTHLHYSPDN